MSQTATSADPKLTYVPRDAPIPPPTYDLAGRANSQLLGYYKAEFANGLRYMLTHSGTVGTISADPLDPTDPEHRSVLLDAIMPRAIVASEALGLDLPAVVTET